VKVTSYITWTTRRPTPVYVGHFGFDDARPTSYMRCTVVGVACVENKLEVTVRNPVREQIQEIAEEPPIDIQ